MAKRLLARTSDASIDALDTSETSDGGWKTNAAGFRFNQNYGFGLIDATELVLAAERYAGVTPASNETVSSSVSRLLPDAIVNDAVSGSLSTTFELFDAGELEEILIELDLQHAYAGDLQANLISPSGTSSRLMPRDMENAARDLCWSFTTNAFWARTRPACGRRPSKTGSPETPGSGTPSLRRRSRAHGSRSPNLRRYYWSRYSGC